MSPIYEYECWNCGYRFEKKQGFEEPPEEICPECGKAVHRVIHPTAVHFKGSGFYSTDNKPDTRVRSASGQLARKVSETDRSNIDDETPQRTDSKGRPRATPTRPKPVSRNP